MFHASLAESYLDVMKALDSLANENHDFKTVVIDGLDWLETLIWKISLHW